MPLSFSKPPSSVLYVSVDKAASEGPKPVAVYHDFPMGSEVKVGQATLLPGSGRSWSTADLACAPTHTVTVDGEAAGEFTVTPEMSEALFIPADPSQCFELGRASYSKDGGASGKKLLSGLRAYPIPYPRIDRWMVPMQATMTVDSSVHSAVSYGLSPVDCP